MNSKNLFAEAVFTPSTSFTLTENGAKVYLTTNSAIVDQFGKAGNYRGRSIADVFKDQAEIWEENAELALRLPFYLRMVTRKTKISKGKETDRVQSGQGARDEAFKRLLWVAKEKQDAFYNNIWLLPIVGSWKDFYTLMFYDVKENLNVINREAIYEIIAQGLLSETHVDLVKKYMPRIKSNKKCTTEWTRCTNMFAKEFANIMKMSFKEYNKLKVSGKAHEFQKLICSRRFNELKWDKIPGRALSIITSTKFLENHNLVDDYAKWIEEQPVAKYTGYVFELAAKLKKEVLSRRCGNFYHGDIGCRTRLPLHIKHTIDAQFNSLVAQAEADGKINENVWCCLDTSGSMQRQVNGLKGITCGDIADSLALFFATLNNGPFHNKLIMFDHKSYPYTMEGESFCERFLKLPSVSCGSTNFQSAIDEIIKIRKEHPEIPLEQYPTTVLVVTDMNFDAVDRSSSYRNQPTNYEYSVQSLKSVFPSEFVDNMKFIWWDVTSRYGNTDFEGDCSTPGVYYFSGFDGSIMNLILGNTSVVDEGTKKVRQMTASEMVEKALNQEILTYIRI